MNRNVAIVVALLVVVVIIGYLVWLQDRDSSPFSSQVEEQTQVMSTVAVPTIQASSSAVPVSKEATNATQVKTVTKE